VHTFRHKSFAELVETLSPEGTPAFCREQEFDGKVIQTKLLKYLFRGEPAVYPTTLTSLRRAQADPSLTREDWSILVGLVRLCRDVFGAAMGDGLSGLAFAQHYGIPTTLLDVTNDPRVALHLAAARSSMAEERTFFRIDLERCGSTINVAYTGHEFCRRGQVQSAWGLWLANQERFAEFDLQQCPEIDDCVEKHIICAGDAPEFSIPDLLDDKFDAFAPYPIALLRGLKFNGPTVSSLISLVAYSTPTTL